MNCDSVGSASVPYGTCGSLSYGGPSLSQSAGIVRSSGEDAQRARLLLDGLCAWPRSLNTQIRCFVSSSAVVGDGDNPWVWTLKCSDLSRVWEHTMDTSYVVSHMKTLDVPGDTISRYATRVCEAFRRGDVTVEITEDHTVFVSLVYGDVSHSYTLAESSSSSAVCDFVETLARNAADAALFREQRDSAVREVARWVQQHKQQKPNGEWRALPHAGSRGIAAARQRKVKAIMAKMTGCQMDQTRALLHPSAAKRARPTGAKIVTNAETKGKDADDGDDDDDDDLL